MDDFWNGSLESGLPLTDEVVQAVEQELGYRLPVSYVALLRTQNGGYPHRDGFLLSGGDPSNPADYVRIARVIGLSDRANPSYSRDMVAEWEYPDVGLVVADTDAAGHTAVMLDYSGCGPQGEPRVVLVNTETTDPAQEVTVLATDFAAFVRGLTRIPAEDAVAGDASGPTA